MAAIIISDHPLTGAPDQSISAQASSCCIESKYYVLDKSIDLEDYELDSYEEFAEQDSFQEMLITEIVDNYFAFGEIETLHVGVVNSDGKILWQHKASKLTLKEWSPDPHKIDWDQCRSETPDNATLLRLLTIEDDMPETPIVIEEEGDMSKENITLLIANLKKHGLSQKEVGGIIWKGQDLFVGGEGGAGADPDFAIWEKNGDDFLLQ